MLKHSSFFIKHSVINVRFLRNIYVLNIYIEATSCIVSFYQKLFTRWFYLKQESSMNYKVSRKANIIGNGGIQESKVVIKCPYS